MVSIISSPCESTGEQLDAANEDPGLSAGDRRLEVFGETTVASKPSKGALDHPASRLGLECSHGLRSGDDLDRPLAEVGERIEQLRSAIAAVRQDMAQSRGHLRRGVRNSGSAG